MSRIKIRNSSLVEQGIIYDVLSCSKTEKLNSDNILAFSLPLKSSYSALVSGGNVAEVDDDYFDIVYYVKGQDSAGNLVSNVECEHVSYRLNDPDYNKDYFTATGTPASVLGEILSGTGFTVGTVEPTAAVTYSAQEAKSRRAILMEFVAMVNGEVEFNKFTVSIRNRRGSATPKSLTASRDVEIIGKTYNAREKDASGNPLVAHTCSMIRPLAVALGDSVTLTYPSLDINTELRVVSITTNPYNQYEASFEIGNFVPGLADDAYRIETSMVAKGATYYGARISPENGFESIRNDLKARTVMNADTFAMQTGDGAGNWTNKLYFDPATNKYIFDGELSATLITALEARFDITISNTTITNILSAGNADIAQLTVDRLETSQKVAKYLASDTSDCNYIRAQGEVIQYITAQKSTGTSQAEDRFSNPLYWIDDEYTGATTEVTDWPVMVYNYTEYTKMVLEFYDNGTDYVPRIVLGTGSGSGDYAKGFIEKIDGGMEFTYVKYDGTEVKLTLGENGISLAGQQNVGVLLNFIDHDFTSADLKGVGTLHVKYNPSSVLATGSQSVAYSPVSLQAVELAKAASDPQLVSAATNEAGTVVTLTFNKAMANPSGKHAEFAVSNETISAAALNADTKKIDLTLSSTIAYGDTVTVSYTKGTVESDDGGELASFSGATVTNDVPQPPPTYQEWENYPDSPILTANYPTQLIRLEPSWVTLYYTTGQLYLLNGTSLRSTQTTFKYYKRKTDATWTYGPVEEFLSLSYPPPTGYEWPEHNSDIYTDATLTTVALPKTT